jgi:hypothetical protein
MVPPAGAQALVRVDRAEEPPDVIRIKRQTRADAHRHPTQPFDRHVTDETGLELTCG